MHGRLHRTGAADRVVGRSPVLRKVVRLAWTTIALVAALALLTAPSASAQSEDEPLEPHTEPPPGDTAFDRAGMWIWYTSRSHGGDPARIAGRARRSGIGTVYVKSGDSTDTWGQFNRPFVAELQRRGLRVCAWQFVYGRQPVGEAKVGAASVRRGADCLVIDAEGHYEGRYAAADRYIRALRARIGPEFPLSLATFPYTDFHPAFPYSVFLGPGAAEYNQPQMYWKTIGTSVREVYDHTYLWNRLYERPIYPLGQTYFAPGTRAIRLFRRFAESYGLAPSWWSWQETSGREWGALGALTDGPVAGYRPVTAHPVLRRGARGDHVVWAQQHLVAAGSPNLPVTGFFGRLTRGAVRRFQESRGLTVDGVLGSSTWRRLLRVSPVRVQWSARPSRAGASRAAGFGRAPLSASLPARANEVPVPSRR